MKVLKSTAFEFTDGYKVIWIVEEPGYFSKFRCEVWLNDQFLDATQSHASKPGVQMSRSIVDKVTRFYGKKPV